MKSGGFSLIELIVVLAILGIIGSIGLNFWIRYQRLEDFRGAVNQVVADLNNSRAQARRTPFHWSFNRTSSTAYTYGPSSAPTAAALPSGISFDTASSYSSSVTYRSPYGNVDAANKTIRIQRTAPDLFANVNIVGVTGKLVAVYE